MYKANGEGERNGWRKVVPRKVEYVCMRRKVNANAMQARENVGKFLLRVAHSFVSRRIISATVKKCSYWYGMRTMQTRSTSGENERDLVSAGKRGTFTN